ncbi:MAG: hypothetical protein D6713_00235 [Deltaproteobacteria bacterium]|nr:MAG: hypothetical protein D6713_00235 [Deltaproteobacteria bacterium]
MSGKVYFLEWRLKGREKARNLLVKAFLTFILVCTFVVLYFSRGLDSYLSSTWRISVFLREGVSEETGALFAEKLRDLSFVKEASYYSPEEVWDQFLEAVGEKEGMRDLIGDPVPGYVEVFFTRDGLSAQNLKRLLSICKGEDIVKDVVYGEDSFERVLRLKGYVNAGLLFSFFVFLISGAVLFSFLDASLLLSVAGELLFGLTRDRDFLKATPWKAFFSFLEGAVAGAFSYAAFLFIYAKLSASHPSVDLYTGIDAASLPSGHALPFLMVVTGAGTIFAVTSLLSLRRVREIVEKGLGG